MVLSIRIPHDNFLPNAATGLNLLDTDPTRTKDNGRVVQAIDNSRFDPNIAGSSVNNEGNSILQIRVNMGSSRWRRISRGVGRRCGERETRK